MNNVQAIVLAAGKSTRFKTGTSKLLHKICGQEMILYGTRLLEALNIPTTAVVGFQKDVLIHTLNNNLKIPISIVEQTEQLGTGHAVACTQRLWNKDLILIMNGDMPLITSDIIETLYNKHIINDAVMSFVTSHHTEPSGYGRVVQNNSHISIVEARDYTGSINEAPYINAGIYLFNRAFLETYIQEIDQNNSKQEFYLTDLAKLASDAGQNVTTTVVPYDFIRGINTFKELWEVEHIKRSELIQHWMQNGVRFMMPLTTHIDLSVTIEPGTIIGAGAYITGTTSIGAHCSLGAHAVITNSILGDYVTTEPHCIIDDSKIQSHGHIGSHTHISKYSIVEEHMHVESFQKVTQRIISKNSSEEKISSQKHRQSLTSGAS
ncbi:NTP transferase domain-containing protein [Candidatus Babeliales bacterium]|nr:NTP transferase domain-containing protein [Candidatus Babeliales bacterium]